jgi:8-oxo-dGTP pyrophosphatase MutT (NUDIX family)
MPSDARAELAILCANGLDWRLAPSREMPDAPHARRAAVLVLFGALDRIPARADGPVAAELDVLLLRRAATLASHPGQIAFPGGRLEKTDSSPIAAAVREAVEETGLDASGLEPLGMLPDIAVPISRHIVTPVPAWWTKPSEVAAVDHAETVEVFRVPVADLLDPANRASTKHTIGRRTLRSPAFLVDGRLVWGFTAIVLSRMFDELGWAVPWDQRREIDPRVEERRRLV